MSYAYSFHPEAEDEFRKATAYYEKQRSGLGDEFFEEVQRTIKLIVDSPYSWAIFDGETRICCTKRFKYGLLYCTDDEEVTIVAVMHLHRKPGYWKKRLQ